MAFEPELFDYAQDSVDFAVSGVGFHYDKHYGFSFAKILSDMFFVLGAGTLLSPAEVSSEVVQYKPANNEQRTKDKDQSYI